MQFSIAEVFFRFCGFRKTQLLIYRNLLVACVKCHICPWCSFTGCWYGARRCDPGSHCWSIWSIQEHCPAPVDTLSRHRNGTRLAAFWTAMCDITGTKCLHHGHPLMQSLSDCLCHILKHFQVTCNQYRNCVQPFVGAQHSPLLNWCVDLHLMPQQYHHQVQ